jgi:hypothetical protein
MKNEQSESLAVRVALAQIDVWDNKNYEKAREFLSRDVHVVAASTQPHLPYTDATGIDKYMEGLMKFGEVVVPKSAKVIESTGDKQNALVMVSVKTNWSSLIGARLYMLNEEGKIKEERVIFSVFSA